MRTKCNCILLLRNLVQCTLRVSSDLLASFPAKSDNVEGLVVFAEGRCIPKSGADVVPEPTPAKVRAGAVFRIRRAYPRKPGRPPLAHLYPSSSDKLNLSTAP